MWYFNRQVLATYGVFAPQVAYANISGLGWRRIRPGAPDGVTNLFVMMNAARANNRLVHVFVNTGTNLIERAYLL